MLDSESRRIKVKGSDGRHADDGSRKGRKIPRIPQVGNGTPRNKRCGKHTDDEQPFTALSKCNWLSPALK